MNPLQPILQAYREGYAALLVTGRSLYDFAIDDDDKMRPLKEILRRTLFREEGMIFLDYSLAGGLNWYEEWLANPDDRKQVRSILQMHGLLNPAASNQPPARPDTREAVGVMRGFASLSRASTVNYKFADGREMRFAGCIEFGEHLMPALLNGTQTTDQIVATEVVHLAAQSLVLRQSGNMIAFHTRDSNLVDELACAALKTVRLPQPDKTEKEIFVEAALKLYNRAAFEAGLTKEAAVALTERTPNRSLEGLIRASHRTNRAVTAQELSAQKNLDITLLSEGTLTPLDTRRVENLKLAGKNINKPHAILMRLADCLLKGDPSAPANILLAGAPSTAKTDLALLVALHGKIPCYRMLSPKGSFVGETERKARLQQQALKEWTPNVGFCDEISEALPLNRSDANLDSGASQAVTAELLTALSDESRRGRSLIIGTTNRPWVLSAAMRSRFTVIPLLHPLEEDFAEIIVVTARRVAPASEIRAADPEIIEAARIFYHKGANPRHIRAALSNTLLLSGKERFEPLDILTAARDLCATTDFASTVYADLWAIKCCTSVSFLPWSDAPRDYRFPDYLRGIVNPETGEIDESELNKRIADYQPYANV